MNIHEKARRAGWVTGPLGYYHQKSGHLVKRVSWNEAEEALARAFGLRMSEPEVETPAEVLPALTELPPEEQTKVEAVLNDGEPFESTPPVEHPEVDETRAAAELEALTAALAPADPEEELKAVLDAEVAAKAAAKPSKKAAKSAE